MKRFIIRKNDMKQHITKLEINREQMIEIWIEKRGVCRGMLCTPDTCYYKVGTNNAPCTASKVFAWAVKNKDNRFGNCNSIW